MPTEAEVKELAKALLKALQTPGQRQYEAARRVLSILSLGGRPIPAAILSGLGFGYIASRLGPSALLQLSQLSKGIYQPTPQELMGMRRRFGIFGALFGAAPWLPLVYRQAREGTLLRPFEKRSDYISFPGSLQTIASDPYLPSDAKAQLTDIFIQGFNKAEPRGKLLGLLTTTDLIRGAVGAGIGGAGASLAGVLLGRLFGLPQGLRKDLSRTGALAGALLGSGIISG